MTSDTVLIIKKILEKTKDSGELTTTTSLDSDLLNQLGIKEGSDNSIQVDRSQRIELAKKAVQMGEDIAEIVELLTWKDFEGFVASILVANTFRCVESFRRRGNSLVHGMEIDVIGVRGDTIISIDAKMWGVRSGKTTALKQAAEKQKIRTQELSNELDRLSSKMTNLVSREYHLFPVLVTWLVEEVEFHEGVPVVPIFKLNSFILEFYQYEDFMVSYSGHHQNSSD
ncbi:MAG: hypothetical protein ACFFFK_06980 [Candidatus Thorarchaeota archaeon]